MNHPMRTLFVSLLFLGFRLVNGLTPSIVIRRQPPASSLHEPNPGYVPDGLTPQEYDTIKLQEAEARKKLDLGGWGPRFQKTSAPRDDWMTNRMLWTNGFQMGRAVVPNRKRTKLSYLLASTILFGLLNTIRMGGLVLLHRQPVLVASIKFMLPQLAITLVGTPFMKRLFDYTNRNYLMSHRRIFVLGWSVISALTYVLWRTGG